ncbi:lipase 1 [Nilaparvata lugens]|uniref:lipase 1 n=1 Tax=Nilaparvata lugens TaxID=108931 RepID=UPI00193E3D93|nr:lipase 1 [Nilaparvata lugens]
MLFDRRKLYQMLVGDSLICVLVYLFVLIDCCGIIEGARQRRISQKELEAMSAEQLINYYGYNVESHRFVTYDGYVLTLHRLARPMARPVLLQHGVMGSTETWVMQGPKRDLPYMMYEAGFDVWIGNVRGNLYGRNHVNMSVLDPKFWEFSWHEMGLYDLPGMLDYIIQWTGYPDVLYVGHSMGTTMAYVMGSMRPEYNRKIRVSIHMAPVAYMTLREFFYLYYVKFRTQFTRMYTRNGIYELLPRNKYLRMIQADLCRDGSPFQWICIDMFFTLTGADWEQLNRTMVPMYLRHASPSSIQTLDHFSQLIARPGMFMAYDYKNIRKNYEKYGSYEPPSYNLSRVTAPTVLFYAKNDFLSRQVDVNRISRELPNVVGKKLIQYKKFNHIDYLWGKYSKKLVYDDIINLLRLYS